MRTTPNGIAACVGSDARTQVAALSATTRPSIRTRPPPKAASKIPNCEGGFPGIFNMSGNVAEWEKFLQLGHGVRHLQPARRLVSGRTVRAQLFVDGHRDADLADRTRLASAVVRMPTRNAPVRVSAPRRASRVRHQCGDDRDKERWTCECLLSCEITRIPPRLEAPASARDTRVVNEASECSLRRDWTSTPTGGETSRKEWGPETRTKCRLSNLPAFPRGI